MKLNRQNTKKRPPNNFPEVRRNKGYVKRQYGKMPTKKQTKGTKIRQPIRRKRLRIKQFKVSTKANKRIKIVLAVLLTILVLLLGFLR